MYKSSLRLHRSLRPITTYSATVVVGFRVFVGILGIAPVTKADALTMGELRTLAQLQELSQFAILIATSREPRPEGRFIDRRDHVSDTVQTTGTLTLHGGAYTAAGLFGSANGHTWWGRAYQNVTRWSGENWLRVSARATHSDPTLRQTPITPR